MDISVVKVKVYVAAFVKYLADACATVVVPNFLLWALGQVACIELTTYRAVGA